MADLNLVIVTPEATVTDAQADFVVVPLADGELGIAPRHTPFIGRLGYGELRYRLNDKLTRLYIDGGFVQMTGSVVSVLTNRAIPAEQLDEAVVREQLHAAGHRRATTPEEMEFRERAVRQAQGMLWVAKHKQITKATLPAASSH